MINKEILIPIMKWVSILSLIASFTMWWSYWPHKIRKDWESYEVVYIYNVLFGFSMILALVIAFVNR